MTGIYCLSPALPRSIHFSLSTISHRLEGLLLIFILRQWCWCIHLTVCFKHASSGGWFPIIPFTSSHRSPLLPKPNLTSCPPSKSSFQMRIHFPNEWDFLSPPYDPNSSCHKRLFLARMVEVQMENCLSPPSFLGFCWVTPARPGRKAMSS